MNSQIELRIRVPKQSESSNIQITEDAKQVKIEKHTEKKIQWRSPIVNDIYIYSPVSVYPSPILVK